MSFKLASIFQSAFSSASNLYEKTDAFFATQSRRKAIWGIVVLFCFAVILFLNILTPMIADDFGYLYIFGEREQVSSLSDLIHSQVNHYYLWGGRSVVHFVAQGLLQMPRYVVDVLNSLVYLFFISLIYWHIKGKAKQNSISLFVLINLAVWFLIPMFGDTILWVTGSANYLWGTVIVLLFLLPYRLYDGYKGCSCIVMSVPMLIFGIIAGWTNENTVAGVIVIILLLFIYYRTQKWNIPIAYILGLVGALIGYVLMIAAPGNFIRGGDSTEVSLFIVLYRVFTHTQSLFLNYGVLIALYLVLLVLYKKFSESENEKNTTLSFIYILGALAAIYAMIFSPQFPPRAWFGLVAFLFIALGIIFFRLNYKLDFIRQIRFSLIAVGLVAFMFSFYLATKDIHRAYKMDKEREVLAQEAKEVGADKCYVKRFVPHTQYVHGEEPGGNQLLSYYYGIFIEYEK